MGVKWCLEFKLLGIYFDVTLSKMLLNYVRAIESVRKELSSWKHRFLTIFGKQHKKPKFVDELGVKWCLEFKLLGIDFDFTLFKMLLNYDKAIESVRKELSSWKHRFLTIFGKVTVIKTLCLPKLNHIVSVSQIPTWRI